jgi:PPK2 family polyphosphate:nucleotide phosphotransferase
MPKTIDHADLLAPAVHDVCLADFDPGFTSDFKSKHDADEKLCDDLEQLVALQDTLYADRRYSLLLVFQGMDAAGKDGAIRHVMSGVSPQGVDVHAFKQPSTQELAHDFLWRCAKVLPERGKIGIFNRSYYEELAVVRVHTSLLERENLPPEPTGSDIWKDRYEDIVAFERHLVRNGTIILKFFLHLSKDEQRKRFLARIDDPNKNWKISSSDMHERTFWNNYQQAYEQILSNTSIDHAPWYIVPADHKWFTRAAVADVVVKRLKKLALAYPSVSDEQRAQLEVQRERLEDEHESKDTVASTLVPA